MLVVSNNSMATTIYGRLMGLDQIDFFMICPKLHLADILTILWIWWCGRKAMMILFRLRLSTISQTRWLLSLVLGKKLRRFPLETF
jgi:hypothetical protein